MRNHSTVARASQLINDCGEEEHDAKRRVQWWSKKERRSRMRKRGGNDRNQIERKRWESWGQSAMWNKRLCSRVVVITIKRKRGGCPHPIERIHSDQVSLPMVSMSFHRRVHSFIGSEQIELSVDIVIVTFLRRSRSPSPKMKWTQMCAASVVMLWLSRQPFFSSSSSTTTFSIKK